ncbi:MAG: hypothetical protein ACKVQR_08460 [Aquabacterium sp.]
MNLAPNDDDLDRALAAHWASADAADDGAGFAGAVLARVATAAPAAGRATARNGLDARQALQQLQLRRERQRDGRWAERLGLVAGLGAALWMSGASVSAIDPVQLGGGLAALSVTLAAALLSAARR